MVVGVEQVLPFEERLHPVAAREGDLALDDGAGREVELQGLLGAPVDVDPQHLAGGAAAGVAHGDEGDEPAAPRFDGEAGDGPVGGPLTDALVAGAGRGQAHVAVLEPPIGEQHHAEGGVGRLQAGSQGERTRPVRSAPLGVDPVEGLVERVAVGRGRQQHAVGARLR